MSEAAGRYEVRPLRREDAEALRRLWNRNVTHDPLGPSLLEEKIWGDPDAAPELSLLALADGVPAGFIQGVSRLTADGARGFVKMLAVEAAHRRRGLGTHLLGLVEHGLAGRGATTVRIGESAPNYLVPGVDLDYPDALAFFTARDYRAIAIACNMTASLARLAPPAPSEEAALKASGISLRLAGSEDWPALQRLLREFGGTWATEVGNSLRHDPPLVYLALRGGEVLGFAAAEGNNAGTGWFGPMGTAEAARGLGIGRLLMLRVLSDLGSLGFTEAIIPWVAPVEFYARFAGARVSRRFQRFEKVLTP